MPTSQRSDEEGESQPEFASLGYHPEAIGELIDTAQFYEECQDG